MCVHSNGAIENVKISVHDIGQSMSNNGKMAAALQLHCGRNSKTSLRKKWHTKIAVTPVDSMHHQNRHLMEIYFRFKHFNGSIVQLNLCRAH